MKRLLTVLIVIVLVLSFSPGIAFAQEYPEPTEKFYVNDFANVLDTETEQLVQSMGEKLYKKTNAQLVVVTVNSLEDGSIEDYALNLFREWGIGDKEKNNGVLLLLSLEDKISRIEVGYGLEGALPDGKTGRIQDEYMISWFKEGNYSEGIKNGYEVIVNEIYNEYGIEVENNEYVLSSSSSTESSQNDFNFIKKVIIAAIVVLLLLLDWIFLGGEITRLLLLMLFLSRRGGSGGGSGFGGGRGSSGGGGSSRGW